MPVDVGICPLHYEVTTGHGNTTACCLVNPAVLGGVEVQASGLIKARIVANAGSAPHAVVRPKDSVGGISVFG